VVRLRAETLEFLRTAPKRWTFEAPVRAPHEAVFDAIAADPSTWHWFPGFTTGRYVSPSPHGVGAIREVKVGPSIYRETIIAYDRPTRWAYRVDETTIPLARALVEEWAVAPAPSGAVVRWTFAIDPRIMFRAIGPAASAVLRRTFRRAMANLGASLAERTSREPA
jgi:hypothetical protein